MASKNGLQALKAFKMFSDIIGSTLDMENV